MIQVSSKINLLSRFAVAVIAGQKQQMRNTFQSNKDSNYNTGISAHRQAIAHIHKVQAEYQIRGWMR